MTSAKYDTNLASEFYVMSVLYRQGLDAHLTLGNKKAIDIVIVRGPGDSVTLDVKAVVGKTDWLAGVPEARPRPRHFVALLTYEGRFREVASVPRAWIFPHRDYLTLVKRAATPSTMCYIPRKAVLAHGENENAWQFLAGKGRITGV